MFRYAFHIATGLGVLLLIGLVAWFDWDQVLQAFVRVGWGAPIIVGLRLVAISLAGLAWSRLLPLRGRAGPAVYVRLRIVREGFNNLLPVGQVGGELIGARLLTFFGVGGSASGASMLGDMLLQVATLFLFALLGLGAFILVDGEPSVVEPIAASLVVAAPCIGAFFLLQRFGGFKLLDRLLARIAEDPKWRIVGAMTNLNEELQRLWRRRGHLAAAIGLHLAGWFVGVFEVYVALSFIGYPVPLAGAFVIESLGQCVKALGFAVPGALGVQEGGFVVLGALFGVPAEAAIALSLVKRVPDILIGVPGLLMYRTLEHRQLATAIIATPVPDAPRTD